MNAANGHLIFAGDQASHQSVLHPDTPGDAVPAVSEKRLSTSSTRYRRVHSSARYTLQF